MQAKELQQYLDNFLLSPTAKDSRGTIELTNA